ncbi:MAG: HAD-IC family P-type ATPase, partial [Patescibacteria group bacterium]
MRLWYRLGHDEVLGKLGTSSEGLSSLEAEKRQKQFGYNELRTRTEPMWKRLLEPFRSIFVLVLTFAAIISFISHEQLDGFIILTIIAVNITIFYSQQHATRRVLKSLRRHNEQFVRVLRDGQKLDLSSRLLVPGDIIILTEGSRIPADVRLLHEENLYVDESSLTGESLPIKKSLSVITSEKQIYDQRNMAFQGTYVISGTGQAVVVETGLNTQFGLVAELATQAEPKSPMQIKIDHIVSRLIKILTGVALVVFILSLARGIEPSEALRFVMAMSVSAVPEDLPIALSVILVLGMRRMAKKNALVRSMKTMEDIGIVTVVAVDKTGTLTKNNLSVIEGWALDDKTNLSEAVYKSLGDASNSAEPFDKALLAAVHDNLSFSGKLLKNYPFEQTQRISGALWRESESSFLYIKGAPEHVLNLCHLNESEHSLSQTQLYALAANGYRVIALARARPPDELADLKKLDSLNFEFLGLIAFADELRPESAQAVMQAHQAGIDVKMITGDHFETAFHIGRTLGICTHKDQVIMGSDLPQDEEELIRIVKQKTVFARILPKQKLDILKALKKNNIAAMTGDGVNDVPALISAQVGIAMGSGNDIAKDAGDILLLDNNFSSILNAIAQGRVIYDNIRRMLFYLLSTTLGEVLTMIGALLVGLPLPVTAVQILWINLVTDTALVIPLGLEPPEEDHMKRPPRPPKAQILDKVILSRIVIVGAVMAAVILASFAYFVNKGYPLEYAQSVAFMMLVAAQWMNAFNARSE